MRLVWTIIGASTLALACGAALAVNVTHFGCYEAEWSFYSVVLCEVEVPPPYPWDHVTTPTMKVHPLGVLSGAFDASKFAELTVPIDFGGFSAWGWDLRPWPKRKSQLVLAVFIEYDQERWLASGTMTYMKKSMEPLEVVDGFSDPQVDATLKAIQEVRRHPKDEEVLSAATASDNRTTVGANQYWLTHAVIFAEVKNVNPPRSGEILSTMPLRPKLTLGGAFDVGKTPVAVAVVDFAKLGPASKPAAGNTVVVVLCRAGDKYRVATEWPEYMPEQAGHRSPICVVKDFSDPIVRTTIDRLKAKRKAEPKERERTPPKPE